MALRSSAQSAYRASCARHGDLKVAATKAPPGPEAARRARCRVATGRLQGRV